MSLYVLSTLLPFSYGRANQRLGQLLIDITATFEDEFHEFEVNGQRRDAVRTIIKLFF